MTARQCAKEILTDKQRRELDVLKKLPNYPHTMAQMHHRMMQRMSPSKAMIMSRLMQQMKAQDPPGEVTMISENNDMNRRMSQNELSDSFRDHLRDRFRDNLRDRFRDEYRDRFRDGNGDMFNTPFGFGSDNGGFGNNDFGDEGFGNDEFGNNGFGNEGFGNERFGNEGFGNEGFGGNEARR